MKIAQIIRSVLDFSFTVAFPLVAIVGDMLGVERERSIFMLALICVYQLDRIRAGK